jgi:hypothetical protein
VIGRTHHLADDRLFECYQAQRAAAPLDPPTAEHLAECSDCGSRFADITDFMDGLRTDADAEIDDLFPAARLEAQRRQIERRIALVGRAAHVISFPGRLAGRRATDSHAQITLGRAAAAAAACLVAGVFVGLVFDGRSGEPVAVPRVSAVSTPAAPPRARTAQPMDADTLLSELDTAIRRRSPELMAFEALTPNVREITSEIR